MRLGGNTLRGSNPRSSALTSSFAGRSVPGDCWFPLSGAFAWPSPQSGCPSTSSLPAAARALPCPETGPARPHHQQAGRDVCRWFASRARHPVRSARAERQGRRDKGSARQRIGVCGCAGSCLMCSRGTVPGQNHSQQGAVRNAANWCFRALSTSKLPGSKPGSWALSWGTCPYGRSVVPILIRPPIAAVGSHAA